MTKVYFSPSRIGFYPESQKDLYDAADSWPDDAVLVSQEQWIEFTGSPPEGKVIGVTKQGIPKWVDAPKPSPEQLIEMAESKKSALLIKVSGEIAPLQDAVDLDMATNEEVSKLAGLKKYRVLLSRVDASKAPNIEWPEIS